MKLVSLKEKVRNSPVIESLSISEVSLFRKDGSFSKDFVISIRGIKKEFDVNGMEFNNLDEVLKFLEGVA